MTEPIQWKVTRLPRRGPKPAAPSYRELCAELTEQLDDLLARSIRTSTERGLNRTLAERILFWLDITPNEAAETLAYDTKCFELIRKARIALTLPAPTRQED
jgi:hypothetical protein